MAFAYMIKMPVSATKYIEATHTRGPDIKNFSQRISTGFYSGIARHMLWYKFFTIKKERIALVKNLNKMFSNQSRAQ
jgi:hypothetical protein